jgi:hypothetical protein
VAATPPAVVYLLNGSADAPALDVYMRSAQVAGNFGFGSLVGPIQVTPGVHSFDLLVHSDIVGRPAGPPLATLHSGDLLAGRQYLAVVAGNLISRTNQQPIQLVTYPASFASRQTPVFRLVNAAAGAPPLQAGVVQNASFITPMTISSVAFAGSSQDAGTAFPVGPVQVGLSPVGAVSPVATFVVNADPSTQAFLVPIGAMSPASGEKPIRLAVVNTSVSPWTVAVLEPR